MQTKGTTPRGPIGGMITVEREGRRGVMTAPTHQHRASAAASTMVIVGAWLLAAVLLLGVAAIVFG